MTNIQRLMISAGLASAPFLSSCGDAFPGVVRSRLPAVDAEVSMLAPAAANEPRMFMLDCDPAASDAALVAVPYFTDVPADDPVYRATRAYVWSEQNPWFFRGRAGEGIGGPHCGYGSIWPMSVILKGLTTDDPAEALACLDQLVRTDARTAFIHESHDLDDAESYTRPWFAWANTLFGELVLRAFDRGWL